MASRRPTSPAPSTQADEPLELEPQNLKEAVQAWLETDEAARTALRSPARP